MAVFEVLITEIPTRENEEKGDLETIMFGPKIVIAKNHQSAGMKALFESDISKKADMERIKVTVRPFSNTA